jgi:predicted dehydrogenase
MKNLLRAISGEKPAINGSVQAVLLIEIFDAIYQSSLTGREVSLS